jgi:hypothetical protein
MQRRGKMENDTVRETFSWDESTGRMHYDSERLYSEEEIASTFYSRTPGSIKWRFLHGVAKDFNGDLIPYFQIGRHIWVCGEDVMYLDLE